MEMTRYRLCLIGYRISYSLSPKIMKFIFENEGIDGEYGLCDIDPRNFEVNIKKLISNEFYGFNVTIPYKEEIIKYLSNLDGHSSIINAVNTVKNVDGSLEGYNTDWLGVSKALDINEVNGVDTAIVLGAGGAAKAAIYALAKKGIKIFIVNRTFEKAYELSQKFKSYGYDVEPYPYQQNILEDLTRKADLIINATPVGMNGDDTLIPKRLIRDGHTVFDMVYKPLETRLLKEAKDRGAKTIDGLWMLVIQAIEAVKIWFGMETEPTTVRRYILKEVYQT